MVNVNSVKVGKEVRPLLVGDRVKLPVLSYVFQGTVVKVTDSHVAVAVPTNYGTKELVVKEFPIDENGIVNEITFIYERPTL